MNELSEGVRLQMIKLAVSQYKYAVGEGNVQALTVRMQAGQGGMVPWVKVDSKDGLEALVNCAHLEGMTFTKKETE